MSQLTWDELRERHATNERRRELLTKLEEEIGQWRNEVAELRLWLFGSFLTDKSEPSDIDVLLTGRLEPGRLKLGPPKLTRKHPIEIQVLRRLSTALQSKTELVAAFNEQQGNIARAILLSEDQVVDLVLS